MKNEHKPYVIDEYPDQGALNGGINPEKQISGIQNSSQVRSDLLERYLRETHKYDLLTEEEKRELAIRVREDGDRSAAHRLVTSNLRLVVKFALRFQGTCKQYFLDLISASLFGEKSACPPSEETGMYWPH